MHLYLKLYESQNEFIIFFLTENADYRPVVVAFQGTLDLLTSTNNHTVTIYDDEAVEPPETFTIRIIPIGPNAESFDLFIVTVDETVVQIIDNDSEFSSCTRIQRNVIIQWLCSKLQV